MGRYTALRTASTMAFLAMAASSARGADGFYAPDWATSGRLQVSVDASEHRLGVMDVEPDGRIFLAGNCAGGAICATRRLKDGSPDPAFGAQATGTNVYDGFPSVSLNAIAPRSGGGHFLIGQVSNRVFVGCVGGDGLIDTGCNNGSGYVVFDYRPEVELPYSEAIAGARAADGTLLVAGAARVLKNNVYNLDVAVARIKADLSGMVAGFGANGVATVQFDLDGEFGDANDNSDEAVAVAEEPDGSIALAGVAEDAGNDRCIVARLQGNGAPDAGFGINGRIALLGLAGTTGAFFAITPDRRGALVAAGYYQVAGEGRFNVARILPSGDIDWNVDVGFNGASYSYANAVAVQPDGAILAAGRVTQGSEKYFGVIRLHPEDGSADPTFGSFGRSYGYFGPPAQVSGYDETAWSVAVANGGIMVAGTSKTSGGKHVFGLAKLQLETIFRNGFD